MKMQCVTKRVEQTTVTLFMQDEQGHLSYLTIPVEADSYEIGQWYDVTISPVASSE